MEFLDSMASEEARIHSLKYWKFKKGSCTPLKMAEAGFYSSGKKSECDWAKCYVCFKELDGWEKDDDPWSEHKKHSSACLYVSIGKKPAELSVEDLYKLEVERMKNHVFLLLKKGNENVDKSKEGILEELEKSRKDCRKRRTTKRSSRRN